MLLVTFQGQVNFKIIEHVVNNKSMWIISDQNCLMRFNHLEKRYRQVAIEGLAI